MKLPGNSIWVFSKHLNGMTENIMSDRQGEKYRAIIRDNALIKTNPSCGSSQVCWQSDHGSGDLERRVSVTSEDDLRQSRLTTFRHFQTVCRKMWPNFDCRLLWYEHWLRMMTGDSNVAVEKTLISQFFGVKQIWIKYFSLVVNFNICTVFELVGHGNLTDVCCRDISSKLW